MEKNELVISPEPFIEAAEKAKVGSSPLVKKWIQAVATTNDPKLAGDLARFLHFRLSQALLEKDPFNIPDLQVLHECRSLGCCLFLGLIRKTQIPFIYLLNWLCQHLFVGGATGTGKTNFFYMLALEVMRFASVWIFDRDKQDYRHLRRLNPHLRVFNAQKTMIHNPLEVPSYVSPLHHLTSFATNFCKSQNLLDGSENMLNKALNLLYGERGIFEGKDAFPTLYDLRDHIRNLNLKGNYRSQGYRDSLMNRLDAMLLTCPETYAYSKGYPIELLAGMSFVLEVKGLGERHGRFFTISHLQNLFHHLVGKGERGIGLRVLAMIDEAKWMISPGYNANIGFSPFASILAQSREVGLGFALADQTFDLEQSIFVQSRAKLCFRLGSGDDIARARKTFGLDKDQSDHIHHLRTGESIVRVPNLDPFVVQVPQIRLG